VLLFSSRYLEMRNGGTGVNWWSYTQSLSKKDGKFIYDMGPENNNSSPQYFAFSVDSNAGTINMIGYTSVVQHYIDDGRKLPQTTQAPPGAGRTDMVFPDYNQVIGPGVMAPPVRIINQNVGGAIIVQPVQPPPLPPAKK
jgi:hypothetical protein